VCACVYCVMPFWEREFSRRLARLQRTNAVKNKKKFHRIKK